MWKTLAPDFFVLDSFRIGDLPKWRKAQDELAEYHWTFYAALASQRKKILDELKAALSTSSTAFSFKDWCRIVSYRYSLMPLSARGSVLSSAGGRFNIGNIDSTRIPSFPALYLAEDFETAFKEKHQLYSGQPHPGLNDEDLVLASRHSSSSVVLKGEIQHILDLTKKSALKEFVNLTKGFRVPQHVKDRAQKLGLPKPAIIKDLDTLLESMFDPHWRRYPIAVEVPSNSQIIGQIAHEAEIEGILYKSRMRDRFCLAVFPKNFAHSNSYVEITDATPRECEGRLDAASWTRLI